MFLTTTAYLPPLAWYLSAVREENWVWEAHENYQKGGWRNRCRILSANGPQLLTVPLLGGKHQQMPIREVRIDHRTDWQRQHARTIRSAYGRSPYFEHYGEELLAAMAIREELLYDHNKLLIQKILKIIQSSISVAPSTSFSGADAGAKTTTGLAPYAQVFSDRFGFTDGLSVLDGLFCLGPALARP